MSDQVAGPTHHWTIRKGTGGCDSLMLSWYDWTHWECSNGCRGSGGRTPWTAIYRWWRWDREYRRNPKKYVND